MDTFSTEDLAMRGTIEEIVKTYNTEIVNVRSAYKLLETAAHNLTAAFGKETSYSGINTLPERCYSDFDHILKDVEKSIRQTCWKNLVSRLGIRRVLSQKRGQDLDKRLDDREHLPDITTQEVYALFTTLLQNVEDFAKEAVLEVYENLHPGRYGMEYKTNQRNAFEDLGKKIILTGYVSTGWSREHPFRVSSYCDSKLLQLDRVFHNLDGKALDANSYNAPLIDAINTCTGTGETEYFSFKVYQNGNLHLEFRRLDLLKEFNRIANDGTRLKSGIHF